LDNTNNNLNTLNPAADEVSSDEYYLPFANYQALAYEQFRNMYTWQPQNLFVPRSAGFSNDWAQVYDMAYIANTILDNIDKIKRTSNNSDQWDSIKGQALFLRGYIYFKAATIWTLAYDPATSDVDLGLPLRLTSNFNVPSVRSNVTQTYNQIINDTKSAISLLPKSQVHPYRSCKPAAYALMAKTYLSMRQYEKAGLYADSSLQIYSTLVDYNTYSPTVTYPITQFNKEIIYDTSAGGLGSSPVDPYYARVDTVLYKTYQTNDLRKTLFFSTNSDGTVSFRGTYEGAGYSLFNGIATDEVYLIRAECYARASKTNEAIRDLNALLIMRYKSGTFVPITNSTPADALNKILIERKKELLMRGTRWMDIKRLNKEGAGINLLKNLNGKVFSLPANDLRYALPLPDDIISLSGMQQNPRN
jgi:tetratricopeptide (TPR) repeat protein